MIEDFNHLIKQFASGSLNRGRFVAGFNQYLRKNPSVDQTTLLRALKQAKKTDILGNEQTKFLTQTIKTSLAAQNSTIDQTIVPTEIIDGEDETLVYDTTVGKTVKTHTTEVSQTRLTTSSGIASQEATFKEKEENTDNVLKTGSVIKARFVLTELLGRGGMGIVYKARDLVRVQAQDSNPYVAVKVLTDAFKKHSSSFIALQREASKAQRLAHPNIATVYDFDHDAGAVYMTMELLLGQNLQRLIKEIPKDGLPKDVALNYIRQLAAGLAYAHKRHLIHCDLKPANIYLTTDGTIKLLDFGITRAIKRKKENGVDDDTTVFDPKTLKALTPAYASIEMFSGEDPDPRDDLYALGCVAYELLTGIHPYKKVPAHKARELNLKPPVIKKLNRKEQIALQNLLALDRRKRTPSIEQFLLQLNRPQTYTRGLLVAASAIILAGMAFLAKPMLEQFQENKELAVIQTIQAGNKEALLDLPEKLPNMDYTTQTTLKGLLRKDIIQHYQAQINNSIDATQQRYDFPEAFRLLNEVKQLYDDSASLAEAHKSLTANRDRLVWALEQKYQQINAQSGNTSRIISILREADPYHKLVR